MVTFSLEDDMAYAWLQALLAGMTRSKPNHGDHDPVLQKIVDALADLKKEMSSMSQSQSQLTDKITQLTQTAAQLEQRAKTAETRDNDRQTALTTLQQTIDSQTADLKALKDQLANQVPSDTSAQEQAVQAVIDELTNVSDQIDKFAVEQGKPTNLPPNRDGAPASPEQPSSPDQPASPSA
jgi:chromosome segregation ATPase